MGIRLKKKVSYTPPSRYKMYEILQGAHGKTADRVDLLVLSRILWIEFKSSTEEENCKTCLTMTILGLLEIFGDLRQIMWQFPLIQNHACTRILDTQRNGPVCAHPYRQRSWMQKWKS